MHFFQKWCYHRAKSGLWDITKTYKKKNKSKKLLYTLYQHPLKKINFRVRHPLNKNIHNSIKSDKTLYF